MAQNLDTSATQNMEKPLKSEMPIMEQYFDLEGNLYAANHLSTEVKAAQAWGVLSCACHAGEIDWDRQRLLFGEFMWKLLKLS